MKNLLRTSGAYGQLWWVILLLAVAVILPTVCLLWFMSQAVKNERLAVRQKLVSLYAEKLQLAAAETDEVWKITLERLDELVGQGTPCRALAESDFRASAIVYDDTGRRIYPPLSSDVNTGPWAEGAFGRAWELEFDRQDFDGAIEVYREKADSNDLLVGYSALIGKARCLAKMGKTGEAIETCQQVAFSPDETTCDTARFMLIANARLLLAELVKANLGGGEHGDRPSLMDVLEKLLEITAKRNEAGAMLPLDQSIFIARRTVRSLEGVGLGPERFLDTGLVPWEKRLEEAARLLDTGELCLAAVERFPSVRELESWPNKQFRQVQLDKETFCYAMKRDVNDRTVLYLTPSCVNGDLPLGTRYRRSLKGTGVDYQIVDNLRRVAAGLQNHQGRPFGTLPIGGYFGDWQARFFFTDEDVFEKTAKRQIAFYIWGGTLVIVLILAAGGFAGQVVGKQMKLNRLKNDFIATVSHELKTPLASMRVLVDTLLEGRWTGEQQATEYLELVAKENQRLSGLVDNFLTFSRMERGKQAFDMAEMSPAVIAQRAAEALRTKFEQGRCEFQVDVADNLPDVSADQDAMVTALVNLLDNAYKYSYDDKRIRLKVFAEDGSVCFSVSDNGVGLTRRAAKRVFKRFYQADRSLSRRSEGCGLGLSIVKFIVDAHNGRISVDSQPGKGSTFTVKIPAAK